MTRSCNDETKGFFSGQAPGLHQAHELKATELRLGALASCPMPLRFGLRLAR